MHKEIPDQSALDDLAAANGVAIAVVDASAAEVFTANDNSICRTLNPDGKFSGQCAAFCGTAFEEVTEVGSTVSFICHAGLECRVVPVRGRAVAAIVGRAFISTENYRKATARANTGEWSKYSPSELFENILMTGSAAPIDKAADKVKEILTLNASEIIEPELSLPAAVPTESKPATAEQRPARTGGPAEPRVKRSRREISNLVERFNREVGLRPGFAQPDTSPQGKPATEAEVSVEKIPQKTDSVAPAPISKPAERRTAEASAWRSFFGSLLKNEYPAAAEAVLEFIAVQYGFSALIWLEENEGRLENAAAFGEMKNRKVRLGIASDDRRIIEALANEMPLELGERSRQPDGTARTMNLFPIGLGGDVSAAIAILDPVEDDNVKRQIARICRSLAPQLEILRLRGKVRRGETFSASVRQFGESLKRIDAEDFWLKLTQDAAEMLKAERSSLMILDEKSDALEIKAMIGALHAPAAGEEVGTRVAKIVFLKNEPVVVTDVSKTGLGLAPPERGYKTLSFLSCPITIAGRPIGVMNFADRASGKAFDRGSLELFLSIAPQLAVAIDRATLKEKAGEFEQLSVTDSLTGLLNRRYMEQRLTEETKRSNRHGYPMSFMMLDVDHFKSFNDQYGHPAGDEALKLVGHVIRETLRAADVAARFGGEEFSILLPQTTSDEAAAIAERIRSNIEQADFHHRRVTMSIGIASCSAELCSSRDLVKAADNALYEAKRTGRNRVVAFEEMASGHDQPK